MVGAPKEKGAEGLGEEAGDQEACLWDLERPEAALSEAWSRRYQGRGTSGQRRIVIGSAQDKVGWFTIRSSHSARKLRAQQGRGRRGPERLATQMYPQATKRGLKGTGRCRSHHTIRASSGEKPAEGGEDRAGEVMLSCILSAPEQSWHQTERAPSSCCHMGTR